MIPNLSVAIKKKKSNIDLMKKKNRYLIKQTKANPTQTPA